MAGRIRRAAEWYASTGRKVRGRMLAVAKEQARYTGASLTDVLNDPEMMATVAGIVAAEVGTGGAATPISGGALAIASARYAGRRHERMKAKGFEGGRRPGSGSTKRKNGKPLSRLVAKSGKWTHRKSAEDEWHDYRLTTAEARAVRMPDDRRAVTFPRVYVERGRFVPRHFDHSRGDHYATLKEAKAAVVRYIAKAKARVTRYRDAHPVRRALHDMGVWRMNTRRRNHHLRVGDYVVQAGRMHPQYPGMQEVGRVEDTRAPDSYLVQWAYAKKPVWVRDGSTLTKSGQRKNAPRRKNGAFGRWTPKFTVWAQGRKGGEWTEQDYEKEAEARKDMRTYTKDYGKDSMTSDGGFYMMQLRPKGGGAVIAQVREGVWWEAPRKNPRKNAPRKKAQRRTVRSARRKPSEALMRAVFVVETRPEDSAREQRYVAKALGVRDLARYRDASGFDVQGIITDLGIAREYAARMWRI